MPTDQSGRAGLALNPTATDPPPRVLLVDDDPALLQLLRRWLEGYGLLISTASNGLAAIRQLERFPIALVVADYRMPGMDGIQLLDLVESRWPDCRRILWTGVADSEIVREASSHRVLTKQMAPDLVRNAIVRAATRR